MSIPQVGAMFRGDRSRKDRLVEYGFRLPCARDNRPLTFEEFEQRVNQVIYISATPADWELKKSEGIVVEQVVRPILRGSRVRCAPSATRWTTLHEVRTGGAGRTGADHHLDKTRPKT